MKVLLSGSPSEKPYSTIPDLGLGFLATALRKHVHQVSIIQPENEGGGINPLIDELHKFKPDLVGIKVFSKDVEQVREALEAIKKIDQRIFTVIGGPHPSCVEPADLFQYFDNLDFAIAGEADRGLPLLVKKLGVKERDFKDVPGLIHKNGGNIVSNPVDYIENLDQLGSPSWDLFQPHLFGNRFTFWLKGLPAAPINTGRGCPFKCTFCASQNVSGKKIRSRSPGLVVDEIMHLLETYKIKNFDIIDDNFVASREYVKKFCDLILEKRLDIKWACGGAHLKLLDPEIIKLMEKAGCKALGVGIESGNDEILKHMRKSITTSQIKAQLDMVKENSNIKVMGQFILGYPLDTIKTIKQTIDYACKIRIDMAVFYTFVPLPGSEIFQYLKERGELANFNWDKIQMDKSFYSPPGIPLEELMTLFKHAYRKFYFRPKILLTILNELKDPSQLSVYWRRAKVKFVR